MDLTYVVIGFLICLGLYAVITRNNLIKIVIGINIMESAIILLLVFLSYKPGGAAPIIDQNYDTIVDPIPQALALTAIVIGASTMALLLALVIKLYKRYGTVDINKIRKLNG